MRFLVLLLFAVISGAPAFAAIGSGSRTMTATVLGTQFTLYTYKPNCSSPELMFVFHGSSRTASGYRDSSKTVADRECLLVVAPLFDANRFPSDEYQRGGIVDDNDNIRPKSQWTTRFVAPMVAWARAQEARPDMPAYLYGFSAGGQFLSRVAAYDPPANIRRFVIGSPSTHVRGSMTEDAPYGFRNFPGGIAELAAYLALPLTIYLGGEDDDPNDPDLSRSSEAMEQGPHRLARGNFVFGEAQTFAQANALPFNWRKVIAPGVGHSNGGMLRHAVTEEAFGFDGMPTCP